MMEFNKHNRHLVTKYTYVSLDDLTRAFGSNVKRIRTEQGLNKKFFCMMVGMGRPMLDKIERGEADVRLSYVSRIADALSVSPLDLLTTEETRSKIDD